MIRPSVLVAAVALASVAGSVFAPPVAAHGVAPVPDSPLSFLLAWSLEAHELLPLLAAAIVYHWATRIVNRAHPGNPMPRWRAWAWYAGLVALAVALVSPIGTYDTVLFSAHMIQHLLITMVAAPLLVLGAPITLLLRLSSPSARRRIILPVLHSWPVRVVAFPVVTWIVFAAVMWASHFSPLFDAALESEVAHLFEHALYLGAALLFWWPVVGADPSPWRLPHPARIGYLFLGMPQSSFLGLAIFSAPGVLYPHYATLVRPWGPSPLVDQQWAGGIMWVGGDLLFLTAMILAVWVWLRAEENEGRLADARLDRDLARAAAAASRAAASALAPSAADASRELPASAMTRKGSQTSRGRPDSSPDPAESRSQPDASRHLTR